MPEYNSVKDIKIREELPILVVSQNSAQFIAYRRKLLEVFPGFPSDKVIDFNTPSHVYGLKQPQVHILKGGVDRDDIQGLMLACRMRQATFQLVSF